MTVTSSVSSTEWHNGDTITLNATSTTVTYYPIILWVINYTSSDLAKTGNELDIEGKIFAISVASDSITEEVTNLHSNVRTLTPILIEAGYPSYVGQTMNIPISEMEQNNKTYDIGTTYNITYIPPGKITGIVTWLRQWFYSKADFDTKEDDTGWQLMTLSSGYDYYNSSYDSGKLWIRRVNKLVEIRGVVKPTAQKTASTEGVQFATIPSGYRPSYQFRMAICQGSSMNRYALAANTNGTLTWARYGTTSSANVASGAWLTVHIIYELDS